MPTLIDKIIAAGIADHILTDSDLAGLLNCTPAARFGMVNKALHDGSLIKIRRGLYVVTDKYRDKKLSKFYIANRIVPHSYISLESALSYHGLIPEHVATVTSILAVGRTKKFLTPFGEFVFYQLPVNEYEFFSATTRTEEIRGEPFIIASPLRALADLVYIKKLDWQGLDYLTIGLRIAIEHLIEIDQEYFLAIEKIYRSKRVINFITQLKQELMI